MKVLLLGNQFYVGVPRSLAREIGLLRREYVTVERQGADGLLIRRVELYQRDPRGLRRNPPRRDP